MAKQPDEDDVDLGISLQTVAAIVDHARAIQGLEAPDPEEADEDADRDVTLSLENGEDLTEESLVDFIDELNEDEQASLIALAWVGRGDYGPEEWTEALRLAAERNVGRDAGTYLVNMEMVGDLLAEGVAAFGLSIEDVER
jgi:hypothetical protein